jgi:ethanolamine utilization cobalamin adenosyltransferase
MDKKPEHMTSLSGDRLVPKTHGRIIFRGLIDTLEADVIEAQVLASRLGEIETRGRLGEALGYLRAVMAAEVRETPLPPPFLFGMDAEELRAVSHAACGADSGAPPAAPLPSYTDGPLAARLNTLRAKTREAELRAAAVFGPKETDGHGAVCGAVSGEAERGDIILGLNRLSSAFWFLYMKTAGRQRGTGNGE